MTTTSLNDDGQPLDEMAVVDTYRLERDNGYDHPAAVVEVAREHRINTDRVHEILSDWEATVS